MTYDIYGETLERGHCEVHPWVHVSYPCPICIQEHITGQEDYCRHRQNEIDYLAQQHQEYCEEQYRAYLFDKSNEEMEED